MSLVLSADLLGRIQQEGEVAYPEEGAGFLLGTRADRRVVRDILSARNLGIEGTRRTRYLIGPEEYLEAEQEADRRTMEILGVFHSHPDHPDAPSGFDRDWAQPTLSYVITSVLNGRAMASRSWLLLEDRSGFEEEELVLIG